MSEQKLYRITYTNGNVETVSCSRIDTSDRSVVKFYCNDNFDLFKIVNVNSIDRIDWVASY